MRRRTRYCRNRLRCAWHAAPSRCRAARSASRSRPAAAEVGGGWQFEVTTDADGHALCDWRLGPGATTPARFQRVRASLLDSDGQPLPGQYVVFCATASLMLRYVSGDGQDGAPGAVLAFPLEVQVVNGADGIAGAVLRATVEQGGGSISRPSHAHDRPARAGCVQLSTRCHRSATRARRSDGCRRTARAAAEFRCHRSRAGDDARLRDHHRQRR